MNLPDIQQTEPNIKRPIRQVGVEDVELPFLLESKYGGFHELTAKVSMRTDLDDKTKGISMSRFLRTLQKYLNKPLKKVLLLKILKDFQSKVGGYSSYINFKFKLPMIKKSPISDYEFPLYYDCRFEGQLHNRKDVFKFSEVQEIFRFFQGIRIQYASYCPCSAELCSDLKECGSSGFPHAQRSYADILVEAVHKDYIKFFYADYEMLKGKELPYIWLEDIVEAVEAKIKTLPYPIIKRVDEQEIARIASENPLFVEDAIRLISEALDKLPVYDWIVKCTHEESIHTSNAIAINSKFPTGGLSDERFI
jgi:GTP cyclohydrolase I